MLFEVCNMPLFFTALTELVKLSSELVPASARRQHNGKSQVVVSTVTGLAQTVTSLRC